MSQGPESSPAPMTSAKASLKTLERRRSERLLITVPIRVEGLDRKGEKFTEETRTLVINREGARVLLKRPVVPGAVLLISTLVGGRSAKFRIVGPTQPPSEEGAEWGIECVESCRDIWGITFPPPSRVEGMCTALIECRRCHAVRLGHLSLVEHEVLGTSGLLVRDCESCGRPTSWSYSEPSMSIPGDDLGGVLSGFEHLAEKREDSKIRVHHRVALQLPIRVRSFYGTEELTRTENVSRGGLCFVTDRSYEIGEVLLITCPYEAGGHNIEVRSLVVRRNELRGTGRKIYGISYER